MRYILHSLIMNFEQELLKGGYVYDKWVGSYMKEDSDGSLHTYLNVENNDWIYEKYSKSDEVLVSKAFTL